jgi:transposase
MQEVQAYSTMTRPLLGMSDHLASLGVTRVIMEATSDYWKPVFYVLEAAGFETWLVNAKDVKHLPGRPRTGKLDAVWLAKVAERQMLRPSFVPPPAIRRLRDLTRYRADWAASRFPDSGFGAISCCTLPVQVLVVDFLRSPVAEC